MEEPGQPRAIIVALLLFAGTVLPSLDSRALGAEKSPCDTTAQATFRSCQAGARGDYWTAVANCRNLPDVTATKPCRKTASADLKDALDGCNAQDEARDTVCSRLGPGSYNPVIDPANFVSTIDNPYFPLVPGTTFIYEGQTAAGLEHNEVFVTHNTGVIKGVTCTEVHDTVRLNGVLTEDTLDWFAQDKFSRVWYMGENSQELTDGLPTSLEGSWVGGVDGAQPGIIMEAMPAVGDFYRQEFLPGTAEDLAEVVSLAESVTVAAGQFDNCLKTKETSSLEPDTLEYKFYFKGVGNVLTLDTVTGERLELISVTTGG